MLWDGYVNANESHLALPLNGRCSNEHVSNSKNSMWEKSSYCVSRSVLKSPHDGNNDEIKI